MSTDRKKILTSMLRTYRVSDLIMFTSITYCNISRNENLYYLETGADIWTPKIYIGNDVESRSLVYFGQNADSSTNLWYSYHEKELGYSAILTAKIACSLDFQTYPFDYHICLMDINNRMGTKQRITFGNPEIYTNDGFYTVGKEIGGNEFELKTDGRLEYDFKFESLPSSTYIDYGLEYAQAQVKIDFERTDKSRSEIFGGYHATTAIFAILSLLSFFIQPDTVPGRMGMLITLYLIQINIYNSVKAPPKRGFSAIEIWFVGIQAPILLAVLEYGGLLALKKFQPNQQVEIMGIHTSKEQLFKYVDLFTFCLSIIYLLTFNAWFWFA